MSEKALSLAEHFKNHFADYFIESLQYLKPKFDFTFNSEVLMALVNSIGANNGNRVLGDMSVISEGKGLVSDKLIVYHLASTLAFQALKSSQFQGRPRIEASDILLAFYDFRKNMWYWGDVDRPVIPRDLPVDRPHD